MLALLLAPILTLAEPMESTEDPVVAARTLMAGDRFQLAKASLRDGYDRLVDDIIALTEVPAPPFGEKARGDLFRQMMVNAGLTEVQTDAAGNILGYRRGVGGGPLVVVAAHLDTVFAAEQSVKVKRVGATLQAPGIGDDSASLAVLLAFARAMDAAAFHTRADLLFVGTVGEEGPGNLRGVRHLFKEGSVRDRIAAFIAFEPDRAGAITNGGVGSRRYEVAFKGPGGHSYEDFGLVSPAVVLADAVTRIAALRLSTMPKTTATVGLISGGTSVNSIPAGATMSIDIRSVDGVALNRADQDMRAILSKATEQENTVRSTRAGRISYMLKLLGERPGGRTSETHPIVRAAAAATTVAGFPASYSASSTDANLPMSRGVPALTLGAGFEVSRTHTPAESLTLDPPHDVDNIAVGLATILLIAGSR